MQYIIEILDGLHEHINYGASLELRLFHNAEYEDYPEHCHTGIEIIMPIYERYTFLVGKESYPLKEGILLV